MLKGYIAKIEDDGRAFKILKGKGNIPLGRHRRRWEEIITMTLKEIGVNT